MEYVGDSVHGFADGLAHGEQGESVSGEDVGGEDVSGVRVVWVGEPGAVVVGEEEGGDGGEEEGGERGGVGSEVCGGAEPSFTSKEMIE